MPPLNFWQKSRDKRKHQQSQPPTDKGSGFDADPQAVAHALEAFTAAESWGEVHAVLEREQALLLTNTAEQLLGGMLQQAQQSDDLGQQIQISGLMLRLALLHKAHTQGLHSAWDTFEAALRQVKQAFDNTEGEQQTTPPPRDPVIHFTNQGDSLLERYARTGVLPDLEQAISAYQRALEAAPPDSPTRLRILNNLGNGLLDRYACTGALPDLEQAISILQQALEAAPPDSPDLPGILSNLGNGLSDRYKSIGAPSDLEQAISAYQQALGATPPGSPDRPGILTNLGDGLLDRYKRTKELSDLEQAISVLQQAVDTASPDSPACPLFLSNLGNGLSDRYRRTKELSDLEQAISAYQQALGATPSGSPDRPRYLNNLGNGLRDRYRHTKELSDLEQAISVLQQAVDATPANSPARSSRLSNLGLGLYDCYTHTKKLSDLEQAISVLQQAVDATPANSLACPDRLSYLGAGLYDRYEHAGVLADLEQAITLFRQAADATSVDLPNHSGYLNDLGLGLRDHYTHTGELSDLKQAIIVFQQAVDAIPVDLPSHFACLNNLGLCLQDRFTRTGVLADLDQAITFFQQTVDTIPTDHPGRPVFLNNLGNGLRARYEYTGALADLEQAITVFQQAVDIIPADSLDRPAFLDNLGGGLYDRYTRTGVLSDLKNAITVAQQAVDTAPIHAPGRPRYLSNLGGILLSLFGNTDEPVASRPDLSILQEAVDTLPAGSPDSPGSLSDESVFPPIFLRAFGLFIAINRLQEAVDTLPAGSPERPGYLGNLGLGLRARYKRTGTLDDLEQAIAAFQQAVDSAPADFSHLSLCLNNLGNGLLDRYELVKALPDLERAITVFQRAVDTTPADYPHFATYLNNLGSALHERFTHKGVLADLEQAITAWKEAWSFLNSRFAVLPVAYQLGQQRQAVNIATPLVSAYLEQAAQHPPEAQLYYCRAFEIVEGSKSRLLTQLVGRGSLPLPPGLSPTVTAREQQLLANLIALDTRELATYDRPDPAREEARSLDRLQRRQELWHELQQLWDGIAKMGPAGEDYVALRRGDTLAWNDIARLAEDLEPTTAFLSFFVVADRALLFVFRASWPAPLVVEAPLDAVGWDDLFQRFVREVHWYDPRRPLGETWEGSLRPLLDQAKAHLEGVERLVLVPAGIGHLLPWNVLAEHAGWRTQSGQPLPLVVLPALSMLPRLRRRPHVQNGLALVVGNPTGGLPFAKEEANTVASLCEVEPLLGVAATKAKVLACLEQASQIHLATHAFFHPRDPLEAGIVLADGVLTAREVLKHRFHADLLVLSACESGLTSSLGGEELAGLSQAFFQAGVRSLLLSLWPVNDPATAALMSAFYKAWQARADKAQALRQAMTQLQQDPHWTHPHYWGTFVLMGDWD